MTDSASDTQLLAQKFQNPALPARLGFAVIAIFLLVMAGWGAVAPLSSAVVANGALQAQGGRQSVQHPYGGVVEDILVREGDSVAAGQPLLRLSDAEPRAQYETLAAERFALLAARGRLVAERDGATAPQFTEELDPAVSQDAMVSETDLFDARARQFQTQRDLLNQQTAQLDDRLAAVEAQLLALQEQRASIAAERDDAQRLLDQQLLERSRVTALDRQLIDIDGQITVLQTESTTVEKGKVEAQLELQTLERQRIADATSELRAVDARLAEIAPQLNAAADALQRVEVVAPSAGRVVGQTVLTKGGVVSAGAVLMSIAPAADPYVVEAKMRLADISSVEQGAIADLRLISIPASQRPKLSGTIETVSADRVTDDRTGEAYYALRIALDPAAVAAANVDLQAGMPVQVVIPTKERTMFDYLISPLTDELNGALREH